MIWKILVIIALYMSAESLYKHKQAVKVFDTMYEWLEKLDEEAKHDKNANS